MYKIIPWSVDLDLDNFYKKASDRGFENNSSKKVLVDCFNNERESQVWILYQNDNPIGSVAAHSLDILGPNSYRICARTCTFVEANNRTSLSTANIIFNQHQNLTAQFFIPTCIDWCGKDNNMYISSNDSLIGRQRLVHKLYCPSLEKIGTLKKSGEIQYRGHLQTFWKLNVETFNEQLSKYPRWI
jgi:hypothetical protein